MKQVINKVNAEDVKTFRESITFWPEDKANGAMSDMDHYQMLAVRSAIYPGKGTPFGLMYAALGLGEAGEVQNKVKKAFRDDGVINFTHSSASGHTYVVDFDVITEERKLAIMKEIGGNLWYIAAMCDELDTTIGEVMAMNLEEIASRSERGTLSGDGDNR